MKVSDEHVLELLREVCRLRAHGHCEYPRCFETACDPHHWFSKKNHSIRYDPDACLYLCGNHHTILGTSAHRGPEFFEFYIIYERVRTQKWLEELIVKKNQVVKFNNDFREYWKDRLEAEIKALKEAA